MNPSSLRRLLVPSPPARCVVPLAFGSLAIEAYSEQRVIVGGWGERGCQGMLGAWSNICTG